MASQITERLQVLGHVIRLLTSKEGHPGTATPASFANTSGASSAHCLASPRSTASSSTRTKHRSRRATVGFSRWQVACLRAGLRRCWRSQRREAHQPDPTISLGRGLWLRRQQKGHRSPILRRRGPSQTQGDYELRRVERRHRRPASRGVGSLLVGANPRCRSAGKCWVPPLSAVKSEIAHMVARIKR